MGVILPEEAPKYSATGMQLKSLPILISKHMPNGNMQNYLRDDKKLSNFLVCEAIEYCIQLAIGMRYLQNHKINHADLACRNLLLDSNFDLKIIDFGLSQKGVEYNYGFKIDGSQCKGYPIWSSAIEVQEFSPITNFTDVWSFAVIIWEIFARGLKPYLNLEKLKQNYRLKRPKHCPKAVYLLMIRCWHKDPKERPNFEQLEKALTAFIENPSKYGLDNLYDKIEMPSNHQQILCETTTMVNFTKDTIDDDIVQREIEGKKYLNLNSGFTKFIQIDHNVDSNTDCYKFMNIKPNYTEPNSKRTQSLVNPPRKKAPSPSTQRTQSAYNGPAKTESELAKLVNPKDENSNNNLSQKNHSEANEPVSTSRNLDPANTFTWAQCYNTKKIMIACIVSLIFLFLTGVLFLFNKTPPPSLPPPGAYLNYLNSICKRNDSQLKCQYRGIEIPFYLYRTNLEIEGYRQMTYDDFQNTKVMEYLGDFYEFNNGKFVLYDPGYLTSNSKSGNIKSCMLYTKQGFQLTDGNTTNDLDLGSGEDSTCAVYDGAKACISFPLCYDKKEQIANIKLKYDEYKYGRVGLPGLPSILINNKIDYLKNYVAKAVDTDYKLVEGEYYSSHNWVRNNLENAKKVTSDNYVLLFKQYMSTKDENFHSTFVYQYHSSENYHWNPLYGLYGRHDGYEVKKLARQQGTTGGYKLLVIYNQNYEQHLETICSQDDDSLKCQNKKVQVPFYLFHTDGKIEGYRMLNSTDIKNHDVLDYLGDFYEFGYGFIQFEKFDIHYQHSNIGSAYDGCHFSTFDRHEIRFKSSSTGKSHNLTLGIYGSKADREDNSCAIKVGPIFWVILPVFPFFLLNKK